MTNQAITTTIVPHPCPADRAVATAIALLAALLVALLVATAATADTDVIHDPTRPVMVLRPDGFELQYHTAEPVPTRVQVRTGKHSEAVMRGLMGMTDADAWSGSQVREVKGEPGERVFHRVAVTGLKPGTRYFYRVWDGPDVDPTGRERNWGARDGWRREYAVATPAGTGARTVIRYPVKVLLMPNVVNVASATPLADGEPQPEDVTYKRPAPGTDVPPPMKADADLIKQVRAELQDASRFFWVNSGMRFWVDFRVVVDDRVQRWGDEPDAAPQQLRGLPLVRSYGGQDYHNPGGGIHTFVDVDDPETTHREPIVEPDAPFPGQVEITFTQRFNPDKGRWEYYNSGGGTYGLDELWRGVPGRAQFLGGGDIAWLTTHEFHHQMESLAVFSLAHREDERIVYNHYFPRRRDRGPNAASTPDGAEMRWPWTSSARHGEHYDGMAYWDRTLTDAQWLRLLAGEAVVVADRDNDGFPDNNPRLPLDEKRFGSSPRAAQTDARMNDLDKAMLATWAPAPLQPTTLKPQQAFARPDPQDPDSDGDGMIDALDPAPLVPHPAFVWPGHAEVDGDADEWTNVPLSGEMDADGIRFSYQHMYDQAAYYGLIRIAGDWSRVRTLLDGEGEGAFGGGTMSFNTFNRDKLTVRDGYHGTRGFTSRVAEPGDEVIVEFRIDNWAEDGWFWQGAGREVGLLFEVHNKRGGIHSVYPPYRFFYTRMIEATGQPKPTRQPPPMLTADDADRVLTPGSEALTVDEGWTLRDGALRHTGGDESAVVIDGLDAGDFDLWVEMEGKSDLILAGYTKGQKQVTAMHDYVAFVGGYGNTRTRMRLFGHEAGDSGVVVTPGKHRVQLSRRDGLVWLLMDGELLSWVVDPSAGKAVDRLAILGGYGGEQIIHAIRYRTEPAAPAAPKATDAD